VAILLTLHIVGGATGLIAGAIAFLPLALMPYWLVRTLRRPRAT
jgi:hypothetical protein